VKQCVSLPSGATASVSRTCLLRDDDSFQHQVRNSSGTFTATAYRTDYGATGANAHRWFIGNTSEAARIDSSGNVGIGTSSPSKLLHLSSSSPVIRSQDTDGTSAFTDIYHSGGAFYIDSRTNVSAAPIIFRQFQGSGQGEVMRINSNGRVGIGTNSPSTKLEVADVSPATITLKSTNSIVTAGAELQAIDFYQSDASGGAGVSARIVGVGNNASGAQNLTFHTGQAGLSNVAERMRIDSSGKVGIGTSSPGYALTVGSASPTFGRVAQFNSSTADSLIAFGTSGGTGENVAEIGANISDLVVNTQNTERMRITSTGKVGIGTSSPTGKLEVIGSSWFGGNASTFVAIYDTADGGNVEAFDSGNGAIKRNLNLCAFGGNVGIRTTSPSDTLHVAGGARFGANDTSTAYLEVGAGATGNRSAFIDLTGDTTYSDFGLRISRGNSGANTNSEVRHRGTGSLILNAADAGSVSCSINGSERLRIDSSGRLLVGTSNTTTTGTLFLQGISGNASSGAYIHLQRGNIPSGSGSPIGSIFFADNGSNLGASIASASEGAWTSGSSHRLGRIFAFSTNFNFPIRNTNAAGTSIAFLAGYHSATDVTTGGTNSFNVFTNGNVTNTNNSYGAISDVKLKENIVDANSQWDDLKALQVRNYNFKELLNRLIAMTKAMTLAR
jgi:hypothetical protein